MASRLWPDSPGGCKHFDVAQSVAVSHHPPLPDAGVLQLDCPADPGRDMALIVYLLLQAVQMALVVAVAPAVVGVTRKVKARLLRRIGPPMLQPYRDLWKLMHKEAVFAHNASWIYRTAPYLIFAATWVAPALVPSYATGLLFSWSPDLIATVALLGTALFTLALAGSCAGPPLSAF